MTPQTRVFPRIHTSYYTYELLIHEMTHDTANEGDPGLASRSAPLRDGPGTGPEQTSAVRARTRDQHGLGTDVRWGRRGGPGADPAGAGSRVRPGKDFGAAPPPPPAAPS